MNSLLKYDNAVVTSPGYSNAAAVETPLKRIGLKSIEIQDTFSESKGTVLVNSVNYRIDQVDFEYLYEVLKP